MGAGLSYRRRQWLPVAFDGAVNRYSDSRCFVRGDGPHGHGDNAGSERAQKTSSRNTPEHRLSPVCPSDMKFNLQVFKVILD
jgi:hypothetical protein